MGQIKFSRGTKSKAVAQAAKASDFDELIFSTDSRQLWIGKNPLMPENLSHLATDSNSTHFTQAEKNKLSGIATGANKYVLPKATTDALGGIKIGYGKSGKNYPVELNDTGQAFVTVPWTDNNTTYNYKFVVAKDAVSAQTAAGKEANPYLNLVDNGSVKSSVRFTGDNWISVNKTEDGNIIFTHTTDHVTNPGTSSFAWSSGQYISELTRDSQGHITEYKTATFPANPNIKYRAELTSGSGGSNDATITHTQENSDKSPSIVHIKGGGAVSVSGTGEGITISAPSVNNYSKIAIGTATSTDYLEPLGNHDTLVVDAADDHIKITKKGKDTILVGVTVEGSGKIASTGYVASAINNKLNVANAMIFKGVVNSLAELQSTAGTAYQAGWTFKVGKGFEMTGHTPEATVEVGDMIIANADCSGSKFNIAQFDAIQSNIDGAVTGPASATNDHIAIFNGATGKIIKDGGKTIAELKSDVIGDINGNVFKSLTLGSDTNKSDSTVKLTAQIGNLEKSVSFTPGNNISFTKGVENNTVIASEANASLSGSGNAIKLGGTAGSGSVTVGGDTYVSASVNSNKLSVAHKTYSAQTFNAGSGNYVSGVTRDTGGHVTGIEHAKLPVQTNYAVSGHKTDKKSNEVILNVKNANGGNAEFDFIGDSNVKIILGTEGEAQAGKIVLSHAAHNHTESKSSTTWGSKVITGITFDAGGHVDSYTYGNIPGNPEKSYAITSINKEVSGAGAETCATYTVNQDNGGTAETIKFYGDDNINIKIGTAGAGQLISGHVRLTHKEHASSESKSGGGWSGKVITGITFDSYGHVDSYTYGNIPAKPELTWNEL